MRATRRDTGLGEVLKLKEVNHPSKCWTFQTTGQENNWRGIIYENGLKEQINLAHSLYPTGNQGRFYRDINIQTESKPLPRKGRLGNMTVKTILWKSTAKDDVLVVSITEVCLN